MSTDIVELIRDLRPRDADRVGELFPRARRIALLEEIVSSDHATTAAPARHRSARPGGGSRSRAAALRHVGRPALISTLGAAAVAAVAVALVTSTAVQPQTAAAAVSFHAAGGDIIATVTDPFAAESQLNAAFAQRGLDIDVTLVPVSPSLVGTVIYTSDNGGASAIQPLQGGPCVTGGGGCPIGLRIPAAFTGQGYITLGRPAKPGETYESQASAFAPGEALHCSRLLGASVANALPILQADKLTVQWREDTSNTSDGASASVSHTDTTPPSANYIWDAVTTAPGAVTIWTEPTPLPHDLAANGQRYDEGC